MATLQHKFVDSIPDQLEERVLYISMRRRTVVHLCVCGCGSEVPTPLSPTDWQLEYDGESISLTPSIGNWEFSCRSHYFITNSHIDYAPDWDDRTVQRGRERDRGRKNIQYNVAKYEMLPPPKIAPVPVIPQAKLRAWKLGLLDLFKKLGRSLK